MSTIQLKPCPFCGSQPLERSFEPHHHDAFIPFNGAHAIDCECGAGIVDDTREKVAALWNRRPPQPNSGRLTESIAEYARELAKAERERDEARAKVERLTNLLFGTQVIAIDARQILLEIAPSHERTKQHFCIQSQLEATAALGKSIASQADRLRKAIKTARELAPYGSLCFYTLDAALAEKETES